LFGEFVTDAAATAGDQNRIVREFHNKIPRSNQRRPASEHFGDY